MKTVIYVLSAILLSIFNASVVKAGPEDQQKRTSAYACIQAFRNDPEKTKTLADEDALEATRCKDPVCRSFLKNCTFVFDDKKVTLKKGISKEKFLPGSASKTITAYSGSHVTADLNLDGTDDAAVILTQETAGSGTFYFAAVALSDGFGFQGSNAVFLDDRIAIENIVITEDKIVVRYLERNTGESMSNEPSVVRQKTLRIISGSLSDISKLQQITDREWQWVRTAMNNDETIIPLKTGSFTINFKEDGSFTGTTDCNNFFGEYALLETKLSIGPVGQTRMYCENSQEDVFIKYLQEAESYFLNEAGQLVLLLKYDSGSMIFN